MAAESNLLSSCCAAEAEFLRISFTLLLTDAIGCKVSVASLHFCIDLLPFFGSTIVFLWKCNLFFIEVDHERCLCTKESVFRTCFLRMGRGSSVGLSIDDPQYVLDHLRIRDLFLSTATILQSSSCIRDSVWLCYL